MPEHLDAYATPVLMKKGRSGLLLTALAQTEHVASVSDALLRHGSTFGEALLRQPTGPRSLARDRGHPVGRGPREDRRAEW